MNAPPHRAFVLAAGLGTRMAPLSKLTPKPLMPLWGRPILDHILDMLRGWGVTDVLINAHHLADRIERFAESRTSNACRVSVSHETRIMGTGGALKHAAPFVEAGPCWIVNGDIAADLSPAPFLDRFSSCGDIAVLWMHGERGPRTVAMHGHAIVNFRSPTPGAPETSTFCGLQLVSPDILKYLPDGAFATLVDAYEAAMRDGHRVVGLHQADCYWNDVGTPEAYITSHAEILLRHHEGRPGGRLYPAAEQSSRQRAVEAAGGTIEGFASLGRNVTVAAGVRLENCVLWDDTAVLATDGTVRNAIVATGARLHGHATGIVVPTEPADDDSPWLRVVHALDWPPRETSVLPLAARPSNRSYARLIAPCKRAVAMHYSPERAENTHFVRQARFLASRGLPVPAILLDQPDACICVVEDLGDMSLGEYVGNDAAPSDAVRDVYTRVLNVVAQLHALTPADATEANIPLSAPFDATLYDWERRYFAEHFLNARCGIPAPDVAAAVNELSQAERVLERCPPALLHRDLQSSNIMLRNGTEPVLIDFQGMRGGPAAYDVASLLCDPYVEIPPARRDQLLAHYDAVAPTAVSSVFWWAAAQRLAQALGAFARLSAADRATAHFARHIPRAVDILLHAAAQLGTMPTLKRILGSIRDRAGDT